tara:strand:+ start:15007 stop:16656 length:1650 start_codon:yes stop_codon:yes gene_type:complete
MTKEKDSGSTLKLSVSMHLVRSEINHALQNALSQLDNYASLGEGEGDSLRKLIEEIRQLHGTFKMLDFRAGERLCEEVTEAVRRTVNTGIDAAMLEACSLALVHLDKYTELLLAGQSVAPSLLVPAINRVRRERGVPPLPESVFFQVNLRPRLSIPPAIPNLRLPFRRLRQVVQFALLGLMRNTDKTDDTLHLIGKALAALEKGSSGTLSWPFWRVAKATVEALRQPEFDLLPARVSMLSALDRMVRRLAETSGAAFQEKVSDTLLKDFLWIVSLAQPGNELIDDVQQIYQLGGGVKEKDLAFSRQSLSGPDRSAILSFVKALQQEIHSLKDLVDRDERVDSYTLSDQELAERLERISDTLTMVEMNKAAEQADRIIRDLRSGHRDQSQVAEGIVRIELELQKLELNRQLTDNATVDPVTLREGMIALVSEGVSSLLTVKHAIAWYIDDGDKSHLTSVVHTLEEVSGAVTFLEKDGLSAILDDLAVFVRDQLLPEDKSAVPGTVEAFADAVTAVEYYLDTLNNPMPSTDDALELARRCTDTILDPHAAD